MSLAKPIADHVVTTSLGAERSQVFRNVATAVRDLLIQPLP